MIASSVLYAEDWFQGAVVLKTNRILKGEISIKFDYNVVIFRLADEVMVLPAHKIKSFYVYDKEEESNRQFVSFPLAWGAAKYHQLFELVLDGNIQVLRRQRIVWYSIHLEDIEFDYYIKTENRLVALNKFKRKVYPTLLRSSSNLSSFVHEHRLSPARLEDILRILDWYNQSPVNKALAKNQ